MLTRREGTTICCGKYRIDRVLGEGGMGMVYAVTQLHVNRRYALKTLHPHLVSRRKVRERFLREGWIANAVKHPGVVEVFEDGLDHDTPFLVMELLEGAAVDHLGSSGAIPLQDALCITHQLLDVLQAAHQAGIVHRDIKPANLFVRDDGRLKVLDFGISKLRENSADWNAKVTTSIVGTPAFMAPEQARGENSDGRADVFGAGATLFTLISGEHLHLGDDAMELVDRASTVPARPLIGVSPETPQSVLDLVARAVAFDRDERWESAAAMRDELLAIHHALFGPLQPERLAELVKHFKLSLQRSATEPDLSRAVERHSRQPSQRVPSHVSTKRAATTNATVSERRSTWQAPVYPVGVPHPDGTLSFVWPDWTPSATRWALAALVALGMLLSVALGVVRRPAVSVYPAEKHASPALVVPRPVDPALPAPLPLLGSGAPVEVAGSVLTALPTSLPSAKSPARLPGASSQLAKPTPGPTVPGPAQELVSLPVPRAYHAVAAPGLEQH